MTDREFLIWLQARLIKVYKENENTDFVLRLGRIIQKLPEGIE
jgi:hypothetical protein